MSRPFQELADSGSWTYRFTRETVQWFGGLTPAFIAGEIDRIGGYTPDGWARVSSSELAEACMVTPKTVKSYLAALVKDGKVSSRKSAFHGSMLEYRINPPTGVKMLPVEEESLPVEEESLPVEESFTPVHRGKNVTGEVKKGVPPVTPRVRAVPYKENEVKNNATTAEPMVADAEPDWVTEQPMLVPQKQNAGKGVEAGTRRQVRPGGNGKAARVWDSRDAFNRALPAGVDGTFFQQLFREDAFGEVAAEDFATAATIVPQLADLTPSGTFSSATAARCALASALLVSRAGYAEFVTRALEATVEANRALVASGKFARGVEKTFESFNETIAKLAHEGSKPKQLSPYEQARLAASRERASQPEKEPT
jgi:hypothetical protein